MFESHAKNGNNEPSGSIFTCPTGSSIVLISCKPETPPSLVSSCPGRMPPQHALSIVFSVLRGCLFERKMSSSSSFWGLLVNSFQKTLARY